MAQATTLERNFQAELIKEIKQLLPGSFVFKMDQIPGWPDLLILYEDKWAALECKRCKNAHRQPNQEYYVGLTNEMSFGRFIFPENKREVLHALQSALRT